MTKLSRNWVETSALMLRPIVPRCAVIGAVWFSVAGFGNFAGADSGIEFEYSGRLGIESRSFTEPALHPSQKGSGGSIVLEPNLYIENTQGSSWSFNLVPFFRIDSADSDRSHSDLREAYFLWFGEAGDASEWELRLGVDRLFWGVAESNHLVDIVNQTDLVDHPYGEIKLGQLMAHLTFSGDWGMAEIFGMPHHRLRTYPGREGRLRSQFFVDNKLATYENRAEQQHVDWAARYSRSIGSADIGISVFDGTSREPNLKLSQNDDGEDILIPHYEQIRQFGLDALIVAGPWLLKLEAIRRTGARDLRGKENNYSAYILGGEYTLYSILDSAVDLTLFSEWNKDERGVNSTDDLNNDFFLAGRFMFNDVQNTAITVAAVKDTELDTSTLTIEFERRLSDQWELDVEWVEFLEVDKKDIVVYGSRNDSYVALALTYNF